MANETEVKDQVEEPVADLNALETELSEPETPAEDTPTEAEKMLRIKLRNGKEYTGKTEREILQALTEDHERMLTDMETRSTQTTEVRGKVKYQQERGPFNGQKYLDMLGTDPMQAIDYAFRHYLGMAEDEDPAQALRVAVDTTDKIQDAFVASEFMRQHQDVRFSQEDSVRLLSEFDKRDLDVNVFNMNAIYYDLVNRGAISPIKVDQRQTQNNSVQYEDIQFAQPKVESRGKSAPKVTGGGDRTATKSVKDYESMTFAQLQDEARKAGILQH